MLKTGQRADTARAVRAPGSSRRPRWATTPGCAGSPNPAAWTTPRCCGCRVPSTTPRRLALYVPARLSASPPIRRTAPQVARLAADAAHGARRTHAGADHHACAPCAPSATPCSALRGLDAQDDSRSWCRASCPSARSWTASAGAMRGGRGCVLVASASFWEGFDAPGDALQLVVIDKLPFPPPNDPLVEARSQRLEAQGRSAFNDYSLPEAAVALKQGAGRLIRRETDRGRAGHLRHPPGRHGLRPAAAGGIAADAQARSEPSCDGLAARTGARRTRSAALPDLPPGLVRGLKPWRQVAAVRVVGAAARAARRRAAAVMPSASYDRP